MNVGPVHDHSYWEWSFECRFVVPYIQNENSADPGQLALSRDSTVRPALVRVVPMKLIKLDMWLMAIISLIILRTIHTYTKDHSQKECSWRLMGIPTSARSASTTRGTRSLHELTSAALRHRHRCARPPPAHPRLYCTARTLAASNQQQPRALAAAISCEHMCDGEGRNSVSCGR